MYNKASVEVLYVGAHPVLEQVSLRVWEWVRHHTFHIDGRDRT